jgi:hypothetical protein
LSGKGRPRADNQKRSFEKTGSFFCIRAKDQAIEATPSMGPHDYQVGTMNLRGLGDSLTD